MQLWKKVLVGIGISAYALSLTFLALPFGSEKNLFVSPDEHATWTFADAVAQTGIARVEEVRNSDWQGLLHPRSTVTNGEFIVPAGFLGMPYFAGMLMKIHPVLSALLGPLCGMLGVYALYRIVRLGGGSNEFAILGAGLLAVHPAWWYYSIRSLMPNVPFAALLLAGVWAWMHGARQEKSWKKYATLFLSGVAFGGALFIRPSEIVWLVTMAGGLVLLYGEIKKDAWRYGACALGMAIVGCGALFLNDAVYGASLTTGYTVDRAVWEVGSDTIENEQTILQKIKAIAFPFGFHEYATLRHAWNYIGVLYPWMTLGGIVGGIWWLARRGREMVREKKNILGGALIALSLAHLVILYGSWIFFDNPDQSVVTLGNSYVRYWIPIFILLAPAGAYAVCSLRDFLQEKSKARGQVMLARAIPVVSFLIMTICSVHLVMTGDDGVLHTRMALQTFDEKREEIITQTEKDAVVITDRADKYLWPYRAVIVPLRSEKTYATIPSLAEKVPLYYFGITLPSEDLRYLQEEILQKTVNVTEVVTINEETLYAITPR